MIAGTVLLCWRKVRTPPGTMPCRRRGHRGRKPVVTESVTENKPPASLATRPRVRVKRRGKSPPPGMQMPGHEKPHGVQDKTGGAGCLARSALRDRFRVLVASAFRKGRGAPLRRSERNDHPGWRSRRLNRIRLIAAHERRSCAKGERLFFLEKMGSD